MEAFFSASVPGHIPSLVGDDANKVISQHDQVFVLNWRDTCVEILHLRFVLDPISRHISKTTHDFRIYDFALNLAKIFENVPSPVFPKSITGIPMLVTDFGNTGYQFRKYWLSISGKPAIDAWVTKFWDTGYQFRKYRQRYIVPL